MPSRYHICNILGTAWRIRLKFSRIQERDRGRGQRLHSLCWEEGLNMFVSSQPIRFCTISCYLIQSLFIVCLYRRLYNFFSTVFWLLIFPRFFLYSIEFRTPYVILKFLLPIAIYQLLFIDIVFDLVRIFAYYFHSLY